ncbi:MAG: hypothetical protein FJ034_05195, partial [Chloroflexi bacterium]|nr:hypothetical protein [Chloroflexota bacterium]
MDIQQLRSWIFEVFEPLEDEREYIVFDAARGNLLIDVPPFSERALRLYRGAGRASILLVTSAARARDAHRYRETLGVQIAAHERDAGAVTGGADVTFTDRSVLRPDATALRVGETSVLLLKTAGGVLITGDLDLASPDAASLLDLEFSAVLSMRGAPIWSAGRDELQRRQGTLPAARRRFGIFLQAPWDRGYKGRLEDQMKPNPLIPTDATVAREAAMGPGTLVVARESRDLIERPARPAWQAAASAATAAPAPALTGGKRPRSFEEDWAAPASPAPSTTVANAARDIQPEHRPVRLGARFREIPFAALAGAPVVDTAGGIDVSPDGREVAFAWDRGEGFEICVAPLAGDRVFQLTAAGGYSAAPRWSPDGKWLAFLRDGALLVTDRDGKAERTLANGARDHAWSPNGETIAYANGKGIAVVARAGGATRTLTSRAGDATPAWSPDGSAVVFTRDGALFVAAGGGGSERRIETGGRASEPRWSPDGRRLAVTVEREGRPMVALVTPDGGDLELPLRTPFAEWGAVWRPDLRGIVYLHDEDGSIGVHRMFLSSRATTPIADAAGVYASPRIGPDSESVVFVHTDATAPADIWLRPQRAVEPRRITSSSAGLDRELLVRPVPARFPSGARTVRALLFVPHAEAVKRQGKPPAIVSALGSHHDRFDPFAQIMANRGYVVVVPSVQEDADLIAAAEWIAAEGIADPTRIGLVGLNAAATSGQAAQRFASALDGDAGTALAGAERIEAMRR